MASGRRPVAAGNGERTGRRRGRPNDDDSTGGGSSGSDGTDEPDDEPEEHEDADDSEGTRADAHGGHGPASSTRLEFVNAVRENHQEPVFCVRFNPYQMAPPTVATVGGNRVRAVVGNGVVDVRAILTRRRVCAGEAGPRQATIYQCDAKGALVPMQVYIDDNPDERFYAIAWALLPHAGVPWLAFAGEKGIIRIIDTTRMAVVCTLVGHGDAVNELQMHPHNPELLLSCSKDHSIRVWNLRTKVCAVIYGGVEGHRDAVLSIDVHHSGRWFASGGMDNVVKIWSLEEPRVAERIALAARYSAKDRRAFDSLSHHFPMTTATGVHRNYVDCVRFYGDLVLSKSTDNRVILWRPPRPAHGDPGCESWDGAAATELLDCRMARCDIWYVRFAVDLARRFVCCGNQEGKIFLWDLDTLVRVNAGSLLSQPTTKVVHKIAHPKCRSTLRFIDISPDGRYLVASADDSFVWCWEIRSTWSESDNE